MSKRSEVLALVIAAGAVAAVLILTDLILGLLYFPLVMRFAFALLAAGATFLGITFLPKYPVRDVRAEPEVALAYLAARLRLSGYRVAESAGKLTVRIGSFSAIRVTARRTSSGCRVRYQPYATPSGWGTLLVFLVAVYAGLIGLGLAVYGFLRSWSFAASRIAPLLPEDGTLPATPLEDRTRSMLAETLSEAYRAAAEAEEALRSNYWDYQVLVWTGAIVAWLLLLVAFSMVDSNPDFASRMTWTGIRATSVVAAAAIPIGLLIRTRLRPRILECRSQADLLRVTMSRASAPVTSEAGEQSAFEILLETATEVPSWIDVSRRGGLNRDPPAAFLIILATLWTISLVSGAISIVLLDVLLAAFLVLIGVALSLGATLFYRRWKRRWDEETQRTMRDWQRRIEEVRARMNRYIQDL
jgi:hypothetical protein